MKKILSVISLFLTCSILVSFFIFPVSAEDASVTHSYRIFKASSGVLCGQVDDFVLDAPSDFAKYDVCFMMRKTDYLIAVVYTQSSHANYSLSVTQDEFGDLGFSIGCPFVVRYYDVYFANDAPNQITSIEYKQNSSYSDPTGYQNFHTADYASSLSSFRSDFLASSHPIFWGFNNETSTSCFFHENPSGTVLTAYDDRYFFNPGSAVNGSGTGKMDYYDPSTYFDSVSNDLFYKDLLLPKPPSDFTYDSSILLRPDMHSLKIIYFQSLGGYHMLRIVQDISLFLRLSISDDYYVIDIELSYPDDDISLSPSFTVVDQSKNSYGRFEPFEDSLTVFRGMFLVSNQPIYWAWNDQQSSNCFFHENPYGYRLSSYNDDYYVGFSGGSGSSGGDSDDGSDNESLPTSILEWIRYIYETIRSLPSKIGEAISSGFAALFVPDAEYISVKYNELRSRFGFVDSISASADALTDAFQGFQDPDEPPIIYMDFSAADSKYDYGGKAVALDLSWYSQYKPTVDVILSSVLWTFFVWRMFTHLPSIISGSSISVDKTADVYNRFDKPGQFEKSSTYVGKFERR